LIQPTCLACDQPPPLISPNPDDVTFPEFVGVECVLPLIDICKDTFISADGQKLTRSGLDNVADKIGAFSVASDVREFGEKCNVDIKQIMFGGCTYDNDGDPISCFDGIKDVMSVYVYAKEGEDIEQLKDESLGAFSGDSRLSVTSTVDQIAVVLASQSDIRLISSLDYVQSIQEPVLVSFDLNSILSFFSP
jgi:hypothetical protein